MILSSVLSSFLSFVGTSRGFKPSLARNLFVSSIDKLSTAVVGGVGLFPRTGSGDESIICGGDGGAASEPGNMSLKFFQYCSKIFGLNVRVIYVNFKNYYLN